MQSRLVPLLACIPIAAAGCSDSHLDAPYQPIRDRITRIDWSGVELTVEADVPNPLETAARSTRFEYRVSIEGGPFRSLESALPLDFPRNGGATARMPVRFQFADVPGYRPGAPGDAEADYELQATIPVDGGGETTTVPVRHRGRFPVLRPPGIRIGRTDLDNDGFTTARLKVEARVSNPNAFDLSAEQLGYELRIGDLLVAQLRADTRSSIPAGDDGKVKLVGKISATQLIGRLIGGGLDLRQATVIPVGTLSTPYGPLPLQRSP